MYIGLPFFASGKSTRIFAQSLFSRTEKTISQNCDLNKLFPNGIDPSNCPGTCAVVMHGSLTTWEYYMPASGRKSVCLINVRYRKSDRPFVSLLVHSMGRQPTVPARSKWERLSRERPILCFCSFTLSVYSKICLANFGFRLQCQPNSVISLVLQNVNFFLWWDRCAFPSHMTPLPLLILAGFACGCRGHAETLHSETPGLAGVRWGGKTSPLFTGSIPDGSLSISRAHSEMKWQIKRIWSGVLAGLKSVHRKSRNALEVLGSQSASANVVTSAWFLNCIIVLHTRQRGRNARSDAAWDGRP